MRDPLLQSGSDRDIDTISWVVVPTSHWKDFVAEWCVPKVVVGITMGILLGVCLAVVCIVPWVPNMPANAALSHSSVTVKVKAADPLTTPPEKVDQERKQFVPFDYKSRDAVDMYCLCRSYSMSISELKQANKRATRAARVCCEEAGLTTAFADRACERQVLRCVSTLEIRSEMYDAISAAMCLQNICPKLAPACSSQMGWRHHNLWDNSTTICPGTF